MKALVLYATITGNNQAVAELIQEELTKNKVDQVDIREISQVNVSELNNYDLVTISPYTYDRGSLPDEALDFYDDLPGVDISGVQYIIIGSGDSFYGEEFGKAVEDFDKRMQASNAVRTHDFVLVDRYPDDDDRKKIGDILVNVIKSINK